jgi:hypothetical protein
LGYTTSAKTGYNWQEQQWLTHSIGHFSDEQKLTMLQTAVHPLQELHQVKATVALLKFHTQKDLDYDAYFSLLLSTASDYDRKHVLSKGKGKHMHMN